MPAIKHEGLTDGVTSEWTILATVKPDQEEAFREYARNRIRRGEAKEWSTKKDIIIGVGTVHDYRWVILDEKPLRVMFMSNFDGDWSQYIDDFFATGIVGEAFDNVLSFCEGYPGRSASVSAKKEYMQAHTMQAAQYTRAYRASVKEVWKALDLQKAFQKVLDDPAAAKALTQIPALRPLLDRAAA